MLEARAVAAIDPAGMRDIIASLPEQLSAGVKVGGKERVPIADAQRIFKQLEKFHPQPANAKEASDLLTIPELSALQGSKLLSQLGPKIEDQIIAFLTAHVAQKDWPWIKRRNTIPQ